MNNFEIVNKVLGWGDPGSPSHRSVWFVGIEEASSFDEKTIQEYRERGEIDSDLNPTFNSHYPIADYTAKIMTMAGLAVGEASWQAYRDNVMWRQNSSICQINLFPLGKPRMSDWPPAYRALFGFGADGRDEYVRQVENSRFRRIRELWRTCQPFAVVCFGKTVWSYYRMIFELPTMPEIATCCGYSDIQLYEPERVILTYHFSRYMNNKKAECIANVLRQWKTSLAHGTLRQENNL
jgi:hypothetical protein